MQIGRSSFRRRLPAIPILSQSTSALPARDSAPSIGLYFSAPSADLPRNDSNERFCAIDEELPALRARRINQAKTVGSAKAIELYVIPMSWAMPANPAELSRLGTVQQLARASPPSATPEITTSDVSLLVTTLCRIARPRIMQPSDAV